MHDLPIYPVGPCHPAVKEPIYLKFTLDANKVADVELNMGYMHKGIEKMLEKNNLLQAQIKVERICGICSYAHSGCYTNAIENLSEITVSDRASYQRMIVAELERIHSYLIFSGLMMHSIGLTTYFMLLWKEREKILDCFDRLTGNRVHHAINFIGSIRQVAEKDDLKFVLEKINSVEKFLKKFQPEMERNAIVKDRFKETGVIDNELAKKYCLIGPNARASNLAKDIRKQHPYERYNELEFNTILRDNGDAFDRMFIRLDEISESARIIRLAAGRIDLKEKVETVPVNNAKNGTAYSFLEAPRGELFHFYKVKNNLIERARIRTPTFAYINMYPEILKGIDVAEIPVVVESMDPCFSCMERVAVIKGNKKTEFFSKKKFQERFC